MVDGDPCTMENLWVDCMIWTVIYMVIIVLFLWAVIWSWKSRSKKWEDMPLKEGYEK